MPHAAPLLQLLIILQMTLLVLAVCLCSGKVLISVQRLWRYSTGRKMEGKMEMEAREGRVCVCVYVCALSSLARLSLASSDPALCASVVCMEMWY